MEQETLNALTAVAKREGRVLVSWIREQLENLIPNSAVSDVRVPEHGARTTLTALRSGKKMHMVEVSEPYSFSMSVGEEKYVHTAKSNRLTCPCPSCTEYRKIHDLPLGGLPKKAKK